MSDAAAGAQAFKALERAGWSEKAETYGLLTGRITARLVEPLLDAAGVAAGMQVLDAGPRVPTPTASPTRTGSARCCAGRQEPATRRKIRAAVQRLAEDTGPTASSSFPLARRSPAGGSREHRGGPCPLPREGCAASARRPRRRRLQVARGRLPGGRAPRRKPGRRTLEGRRAGTGGRAPGLAVPGPRPAHRVVAAAASRRRSTLVRAGPRGRSTRASAPLPAAPRWPDRAALGLRRSAAHTSTRRPGGRRCAARRAARLAPR